MGRWHVNVEGRSEPQHLESPDWLHAVGRALRLVEGWASLEQVSVVREGTAILVRSGDRLLCRLEPQDAPAQTDGQRLLARAGALLEQAQALVPAQAGAVLWAEGNFLRFLTVTGSRAGQLTDLRVPAHVGVAGWVHRSGQPRVEHTGGGSGRHNRTVDRLTGFRTDVLVAVPISVGAHHLGVLELVNPEAPVDRSKLRELTLLARTFARWASTLRIAEQVG